MEKTWIIKLRDWNINIYGSCMMHLRGGREEEEDGEEEVSFSRHDDDDDFAAKKEERREEREKGEKTQSPFFIKTL